MNCYFHPSPRPSSLELLSDEDLLDIYELAVEANVLPDFIEIIKNVINSRNLMSNSIL